jgi:hypothetical protein
MQNLTTVCMVYLLLLLIQTLVHPLVDNSELHGMWKETVEKYKVQGPIPCICLEGLREMG